MGDVVGHGIPAASLMAQLRNALRAYVWDGMAPAEVLGTAEPAALRPRARRHGDGRRSVCSIRSPRELRFANAGHPPLLHVAGDDATFVGEGLGPPLGAIPFARYQETRLELRPNDTAVFYTDGLVEDRTTSLDAGLARMREAVVAGADTIDELCRRSRRVVPRRPDVDDDVAAPHPALACPLGDTLDAACCTAEPRVLASLRQTLRRWIHEHEVTETDSQDVLVACGEACNNAIEHGSASLNGSFEVEATMRRTSSTSWCGMREHGGNRATTAGAGGSS